MASKLATGNSVVKFGRGRVDRSPRPHYSVRRREAFVRGRKSKTTWILRSLAAAALSLGTTTVAAAADPPSTASPESATCVDVNIHGVRNAEGKVIIAVFDSEERYSESSDAFQLVVLDAVEGALTTALCDLPSGAYALSVFHDEDADHELDLGRLGIPREGYGFSNGVRPRMGKPGFDKIAFQVNAGTAPAPQDVFLIYWF